MYVIKEVFVMEDPLYMYRKSGNFRCLKIFVGPASRRRLNARKFFNNENFKQRNIYGTKISEMSILSS